MTVPAHLGATRPAVWAESTPVGEGDADALTDGDTDGLALAEVEGEADSLELGEGAMDVDALVSGMGTGVSDALTLADGSGDADPSTVAGVAGEEDASDVVSAVEIVSERASRDAEGNGDDASGVALPSRTALDEAEGEEVTEGSGLADDATSLGDGAMDSLGDADADEFGTLDEDGVTSSVSLCMQAAGTPSGIGDDEAIAGCAVSSGDDKTATAAAAAAAPRHWRNLMADPLAWRSPHPPREIRART